MEKKNRNKYKNILLEQKKVQIEERKILENKIKKIK